MALLFMDGFDRYSVDADLALGWTVGSTPVYSATGGVFNNGGYASITNGGTSKFLNKTFAGSIPSGNGVHFAFQYYVTALPSGSHAIIALGTDIAGVTSGSAARLFIDNNGALGVTEHNLNIGIAASANGTIAAGTWYSIEFAAKFNTSGSGGYIKVWVNGNLVINFAGTTQSGTVPTTYTDLRLQHSNTTGTSRFDDVVIWDETGTDFALTQLSASYIPVIETLSVDGDDTVQFTHNTGASNFAAVDDPAFHNADTDYNFSTTVGHEDLFTLANQISTPAYVFAVGLKTVWKIDIAGIIAMRDKIKSGTTVTYSADRVMTTSYVLAFSGYGKDPDTSAVWGTTAVNSLKVGYKYQS